MIRVVSAEIHGSGVVESVNGMFEIDSVNRVGWNERCNPGTGQCEEVQAPDDTPCADLNPCTLDDVCVDGACTGTPSPRGWISVFSRTPV